MKYVFTQFAAESRFLARNQCVSVELGYEDYLSDNGYSYTINLFAPDAYYKWRYLTITDMSGKSTKLPYVPGDEIYFVPSRELDKFKELKEDGNNFRYVEKIEFYNWVQYNGSPRLKDIANNYLKNTKCNYTQFKNLNVGDLFKLTDGTLLYIKVGPWNSVVLTGDERGWSDIRSPETNVEIVKTAFLTDHDNLDFMTYGGVPMDIVKYTKSDCESTWRLYKEMGNTIKKVIFNNPATIVIWGDGSKTVVKCQKGETFDPEKGLAMAISKKMLGNDHKYYETFAKYVGRYNKKHKEK